jgi:hypothetical protein
MELKPCATSWKLTAFLVASAALSSCGRDAGTRPGNVQILDPVPVAQSAVGIEFSRITDIAVDSRGQIYAGDLYGNVSVLNPDGTLARRFGRLGDGPGEFQSLGTLHVLDGDSLYVYDGSAQRATVYVPNSDRVAYTLKLSQPDFSFPMEVEPYGAGTLIGHFRRMNGEVPGAGERKDDVVRMLNRDGSIGRDTVITVPEPAIVEVRTETTQGFYFPEFARQSLVRWGPEGLIYSLWTDSARVHIHDTAGKSRGSFNADLGVSRLPLAATTIDSVADTNANPGTPRHTLVDAFSTRWKTWPLVQDMIVDDQSRIWILPVSHAPQVRWIAFDARGGRLATLELPRSVRPRLIRGDRLYAVSRDSLDVETLAVYRLAPSSTRTPEGS